MHSDQLTSNPHLNNWRAHFQFDALYLSVQLGQWHRGLADNAPADTESVQFERTISPNTSWELDQATLGLPLLRYLYASAQISLRRRLVEFLKCRLERNAGEVIRNFTSITALSRNEGKYLYQEVHLDSCQGYVDATGNLGFKIAKGSTFFLDDAAFRNPDVVGAEGFRQRFDTLPEQQRIVRLKRLDLSFGSGWLMRPLRFYLRALPRQPGDYYEHRMYLAFESDRDGQIPASFMTPSQVAETLERHVPSALVDWKSLPSSNSTYEHDLLMLANLLFPEGYLRSPIGYVDESTHIVSGWYATDYVAPSNGTPANTALLIGHAEPLVKIIDGVRSREYVEVDPEEASQSWQLAGAAQGALEEGVGFCWYIPPPEVDLQLDLDGKTRSLPAFKSGFEPVVIDLVMSGTPDYPLCSTFVILNAQPTHHFRVEVRQGRVALTFCYFDRSGEEVVVASEDTEWKVLAGDGSMSPSGVFTPGQEQGFSVVMAIEHDERRWYWAVIILPVPLMSADKFAGISNG